MSSDGINEKIISREIKRIPHPKKVKKGEEKLVLNYRLEEVCGYGIFYFLSFSLYILCFIFHPLSSH